MLLWTLMFKCLFKSVLSIFFFLIIYLEVEPVLSNSLWLHGPEPTRLLHSWNFPGKSTGVGCHFLLQAIFSTQGSDPGFPHCRQMCYHLSHQGTPLEVEKIIFFVQLFWGIITLFSKAVILFHCLTTKQVPISLHFAKHL